MLLPLESSMAFRLVCEAEFEEANNITYIPLDEEIWSALKSIKPYKASGSDGLHAGFFSKVLAGGW